MSMGASQPGDRIGSGGDGHRLDKHKQEGQQPAASWCLCRRGQLQTGQCPGADGAGLEGQEGTKCGDRQTKLRERQSMNRNPGWA